MSLDFDFFSIDPKFSKPKKGRILISEPFLGDQYFKRSVVFLTEHNKEGSVGFVLNKPVNVEMKEVVKDFPDVNSPVSMGGPVGTDSVHYIHTLGEMIPESVPVYKDIYWGGDFTTVKDLLASGLISNDKIRFFVGYSGWAPKQLANEISVNSWVIADMDTDRIMGIRSESIWQEALSKLGSKYKLWTSFPENPDMN